MFEKVSQEEALGEVAAIFADIRATLKIDFVPNFFQTLGRNAPNVLRGTWEAYKHVNWLGPLPPYLKEMIFTAVSNAKNCTYCEVAHLAFCAALSVDPESLVALTTDITKVNPLKTRATLQFSVDCALSPLSIDEKRRDDLKSHGFTDGEIVEIIAMVSFALYAINLADAMKIEIDDDFKQILRQGLPGWQAPQKTIAR